MSTEEGGGPKAESSPPTEMGSEFAQSKIGVSVRVRPGWESEAGRAEEWTTGEEEGRIWRGTAESETFAFDRVFGPAKGNREVYDAAVAPIVAAALAGYNGTVFAYGQTGSGKTHTIHGSPGSPGVVTFALRQVFEHIQTCPDKEFLLGVSFLEIYQEQLFDLLGAGTAKLAVRETGKGEVVVCGLEETLVRTEDDIVRLIAQGQAQRRTAKTAMNDRSSRSHVILRLQLVTKPKGSEDGGTMSVLNFVDLAGSENSAAAGTSGTRLEEGKAINKSLTFLTTVIRQLADGEKEKGKGKAFVNFRDSKLTRILQASLDGSARVSLIATVAPSDVSTSKSTLQFAQRAKSVKTKAEINSMAGTDDNIAKRFEKQIQELQRALSEARAGEGEGEGRSGTETERQQEMAAMAAEQDRLKQQLENLQHFLIHSHSAATLVDDQPGGPKKHKSNRRHTMCPSTLLPQRELQPLDPELVAKIRGTASLGGPRPETPDEMAEEDKDKEDSFLVLSQDTLRAEWAKAEAAVRAPSPLEDLLEDILPPTPNGLDLSDVQQPQAQAPADESAGEEPEGPVVAAPAEEEAKAEDPATMREAEYACMGLEASALEESVLESCEAPVPHESLKKRLYGQSQPADGASSPGTAAVPRKKKLSRRSVVAFSTLGTLAETNESDSPAPSRPHALVQPQPQHQPSTPTRPIPSSTGAQDNSLAQVEAEETVGALKARVAALSSELNRERERREALEAIMEQSNESRLELQSFLAHENEAQSASFLSSPKPNFLPVPETVAKERLDALEEELEELKKALHDAQAEKTKTDKALQNAKQDSGDFQYLLGEEKKAKKKANEEMMKVRTALEEAQEKLENQEKQREMEQAQQSQSSQEEVEKLQKSLEETKQRLLEAEDVASAKETQLLQGMATLQAQHDELKQQLESQQEEKAQTELQVKKLHEKLETAESSQEEVVNLKECLAESKELFQKAEDASGLKETQLLQEKATLQAQHDELKQQLESQQQEKAQTELQIKQLQEKLEEAESSQEEVVILQECLAESKELFQKAEDAASLKETQLLEEKSALEKQQEELREQLKSRADEKAQVEQEAKDFREKLTVLEEHQETLKHQLGIQEEATTQAELQVKALKEELTETQAALDEAEKSEGRQVEVTRAELGSIKAVADKLQQKVQLLQTSEDQARQKEAALQQDKDALETDNRELAAKLEEAVAEAAKAQASAIALEAQLADLAQDKDRLEGQVTGLEAKLSDLNQKLTQVPELEERAKAAEATLESEQTARAEEKAALEAQVAETQRQMADLQASNEEARQNLASALSDKADLETAKQELAAKCEEAQAELARAQSRSTDLDADVAKHKDQLELRLDETTKRAEAAEASLGCEQTERASEKAALETRLGETEQRLTVLQESEEEARQKLAALQLDKEALETAKQELTAKHEAALTEVAVANVTSADLTEELNKLKTEAKVQVEELEKRALAAEEQGAQLQTRIVEMEEQLATAKAEAEEAKKRLEELEDRQTSFGTDKEGLEARLKESEERSAAAVLAAEGVQEELAEQTKRAEAAEASLAADQAQRSEEKAALEEALAETERRLAGVQARSRTMAQELRDAEATEEELREELERLEAQPAGPVVDAAQAAEAEAMRAARDKALADERRLSDELRAAHAQVAELKDQLKHLTTSKDTVIAHKSEKINVLLNKLRLAEAGAQGGGEFTARLSRGGLKPEAPKEEPKRSPLPPAQPHSIVEGFMIARKDQELRSKDQEIRALKVQLANQAQAAPSAPATAESQPTPESEGSVGAASPLDSTQTSAASSLRSTPLKKGSSMKKRVQSLIPGSAKKAAKAAAKDKAKEDAKENCPTPDAHSSKASPSSHPAPLPNLPTPTDAPEDANESRCAQQ